MREVWKVMCQDFGCSDVLRGVEKLPIGQLWSTAILVKLSTMHTHATSETTVAQDSLAAELRSVNGTKSLHSPCIDSSTINKPSVSALLVLCSVLYTPSFHRSFRRLCRQAWHRWQLVCALRADLRASVPRRLAVPRHPGVSIVG